MKHQNWKDSWHFFRNFFYLFILFYLSVFVEVLSRASADVDWPLRCTGAQLLTESTWASPCHTSHTTKRWRSERLAGNKREREGKRGGGRERRKTQLSVVGCCFPWRNLKKNLFLLLRRYFTCTQRLRQTEFHNKSHHSVDAQNESFNTIICFVVFAIVVFFFLTVASHDVFITQIRMMNTLNIFCSLNCPTVFFSSVHFGGFRTPVRKKIIARALARDSQLEHM